VLAPILGHAFSPFLGFHGGKALACTFGAWSALTVPFGPFVMGGSVFLFHKVFTVSGWAVMGAMLMLLIFLLIAGAALPILAAWAGTVMILAWTHRADLRQPPALRPRVRAWFGR
jgi:glycerol-3-phosphate acyltransferase PlsY